MPPILVDTWFFVAHFNRRDPDHDSAARMWRRMDQTQMVTHDAVLAEFLTFFAEFGPTIRQKVVRAVQNLPLLRVEVVPQDRSLFLKALALYEERPDKGYSFADCMSMIVMRERGITEVLTNDHHFRQEGFTVVNQ
ncbi:MAG TPA: PIN domain-containing protein [Thermoanaerobaculia bacterium]|jgi:predicted nucleic acid-binding protein